MLRRVVVSVALVSMTACESGPSGTARDARYSPASHASDSQASTPVPRIEGGSAASAAVAATTPPATPPATPAPKPLQRMPQASAADVAGSCTASAALPIGKSSVDDVSGPGVTIAAAAQGVVAAWSNSDSEVTTLALDAAGHPQGQPRTVRGTSYPRYPRLWEVGDGAFVLGLALPRPPSARGPTRALQRIDASGVHVGPPVTFRLDDVKDVTPTDDGLRILTQHIAEREILAVTPTPEGLAVHADALPSRPEVAGDAVVGVHLLVGKDGKNRIVSDFSNGHRVVDDAEGRRVELDLPDGYGASTPRLTPAGNVVWVSCKDPNTARQIEIIDGQPRPSDIDRGICAVPSRWSVLTDWSDYTGKNKGLVFRPNPLAPNLILSREVRQFWFYDATWSGSHVVAIYAEGRRRDWNVILRVITCQRDTP